MIVLICANCNTECEINNLDNIIECKNCGEEVSKENAGSILGVD